MRLRQNRGLLSNKEAARINAKNSLSRTWCAAQDQIQASKTAWQKEVEGTNHNGLSIRDGQLWWDQDHICGLPKKHPGDIRAWMTRTMDEFADCS